jgi:hypothetical protein
VFVVGSRFSTALTETALSDEDLTIELNEQRPSLCCQLNTRFTATINCVSALIADELLDVLTVLFDFMTVESVSMSLQSCILSLLFKADCTADPIQSKTSGGMTAKFTAIDKLFLCPFTDYF